MYIGLVEMWTHDNYFTHVQIPTYAVHKSTDPSQFDQNDQNRHKICLSVSFTFLFLNQVNMATKADVIYYWIIKTVAKIQFF